MAILIHEDTQVIIQGITGKHGTYHTLKMLEYNVKVAGGTSPGKGGKCVHGLPVYHTVAAAKREYRIDATMILVPPAAVLEAAIESIESRIPLVVVISEFIPLHDTLVMKSLAAKAVVNVIGPNTIGVISPGKSKVGIMPGYIYREGEVGVISRSGTLTHEICSNLSFSGIGQSTCVCIGGDAVRGTDFVEMLELFRVDDQTKTIVMIGEIGGAGEELAAQHVKKSKYPKKIIAYIAGLTAPEGKKMGHAGAIVSAGFGTAESKIDQLTSAGITVAKRLDDMSQLVSAERTSSL